MPISFGQWENQSRSKSVKISMAVVSGGIIMWLWDFEKFIQINEWVSLFRHHENKLFIDKYQVTIFHSQVHVKTKTKNFNKQEITLRCDGRDNTKMMLGFISIELLQKNLIGFLHLKNRFFEKIVKIFIMIIWQ